MYNEGSILYKFSHRHNVCYSASASENLIIWNIEIFIGVKNNLSELSLYMHTWRKAQKNEVAEQPPEGVRRVSATDVKV